MSRKLVLSLLAVVIPPMAAYLAAPQRPRLALAVSSAWVTGLTVFFGLMAGPGFLIILLATVLALRAIWRRQRTVTVR